MATYSRNNRLLYVDDEESLLSAFNSLMRKEDMEIHTHQDPLHIEKNLKEVGPFAVVFSDQRMPGLDGVGVLECVSHLHPSTVRVMVTGFANHEDTLRAINIGGISYHISKPWKDEELRGLARDSINRYNLVEENRFLVDELSAANKNLHELLEGTVSQTVRLLGDMVGYVNPQGAALSSRIRELGEAFIKLMPDIDPQEPWNIRRAFALSFLGLAVLPPWIQISLNKQGLKALTRFPVAKNHHLVAAELLKDIPRFGEVARILCLQEKNFDGSGEPAGETISGLQIPVGARLLHILIDLERLTTDRFKGRQVLEWMSTQEGKYDSTMIGVVLHGATYRAATETDLEVGIADLQPAMIILADVVSKSGQCLFWKGAALSATSISVLRQWHSKDPVEGNILVRVRTKA